MSGLQDRFAQLRARKEKAFIPFVTAGDPDVATTGRVIRELAATGSELIILHLLSPQELDPAIEGDLRLVDVESGEGIDVTVDLATLDGYKQRLDAWTRHSRTSRRVGAQPTSLCRPMFHSMT